MKDLQLPLLTVDIEKFIPHRAPFLLIDKIIEVQRDEPMSLTAVKNITVTEPILAGHFPGRPIYPGVLIVEGMAQAAAVLGRIIHGEAAETCLLTQIEDARFRRQAVPGDTLHYRIVSSKRRKEFYWFKAEAFCGEDLVCSTQLSALMK